MKETQMCNNVTKIVNEKFIYRIFGNSRACGWEQIHPEYTERDAIETAEGLDPDKYYQYAIIGYSNLKSDPIFIKSRFLDYDKPITLRKGKRK